MENQLILIWPGVKRLAELEGCEAGMIGFVPCITIKEQHEVLNTSALTRFVDGQDYSGLTEYIQKTCRELKA